MSEFKETKLVFDAKIARRLLKMGFVVVDIKPNRDNVDKSIFVFNNTKEFRKALYKVRTEVEEN